MNKITMTKAYWLAFSILAAWATFAFFTMSTLIESQKKYGKLINLSGKQRMLSQKSAYYAHLQFDNKMYVKKLQLLIKEMQSDYTFILNNLPSSPLSAFYLGENGLDGKVQHYFHLLHNFSVDPSKENLLFITNASQPLLKKLNQAVSIFEKENEEIIIELRNRELFIYIGTLLTLILEALFIVKPMITSHKKYLNKLEEEVECQTKEIQIFEKIFENSNEGMIITDEENVILNVNDAFSEITGYLKSEALGNTPKILSSGKHDQKFYEEMWNTLDTHDIWSGEIINKRKNGQTVFEFITIMKLFHRDLIYYVSIFSDISERVHHMNELNYLATHDSLTGLLNRSAISNRIEHAIELSDRTEKALAVLFIDLDNFKIINDSMGHAVGDKLLQEFAKHLQSCIRQADTLARIGGDEFVILLETMDKKGLEASIINKIIEVTNRPFIIDNKELFIGASIGVTYYPNESRDKTQLGQNLIKQADLAMYKAKELGKNQIAYYTEDLADTVTSKMMIEQQLRDAINTNELELYLQAKIDMQTGKIVGAEMLLRWNKDGEVIFPDTFIPVAEETNLIKQIDLWVAKESVAILEELHTEGYSDFSIAFNLSGRSFSDKKIVDTILNTLYESRKEKYIEIEITEGILIENFLFASQTIKKIKSLGVSLSLDDFGTGYSSFSYLSEMPFDTIKIDRSFISNIHHEKQKTLVEAIIWFSNKLDMKIIAEGVETQEQYNWLKDKNCQYAQGYLFSKPVTLNEFRKLLNVEVI
jgi:diguanylate cyclase (GGDEF)-like protein/PAS domain S-box-containing protein